LISDPKKIPLLDEITAGLNDESETTIQKVIDEIVVQNERNAIIVPYHLSTIQN